MPLQFSEKYRTWGGTSLGDEQVEAIDFLLKRQGAILALQTGLGKTLTILVAAKIVMDAYSNARTVIVCPVKALKAFKRETKKMGFSNREVGIVATSEFEYDVTTNKIIIFTDTNIDKYQEIVAEVAAQDNKIILVMDEAHKLQDTKSKIYQTMLAVKSISTIVWLATATPLLNGLDSLYHIVNFACPRFLGTKTAFDNRYTVWHLKDQYVKGGAKRKVKVIDGYKNLGELNTRLKEVMIVRAKQYNLKFAYIQRELTDEEYKIYEKVSSGLIDFGADERNFSRRMHDLQRFIDRAYDGDDSIKELVRAYNKSEFSMKESTLVESLRLCLDKGYSTIIYCDYKETVERLATVLRKKRVDLGLGRIFKITGSIDIKTRESVEEKIGQRDVVLITSAGTESINLQRCNCLIMYDTPFSVKQTIQAVGRICRRDSQYPYQYVILITMMKTIDEYKYRLFQTNLSLVQGAVGAGNDIPLCEEYLVQDSREVQKLKDELLWAYKGSPEKKKLRKEKKEVRDKLTTCTLKDAPSQVAVNKFLIEPLTCNDPDIKTVPALFPDVSLYDRFVKGEIPFTVLRSRYIEFLRSPAGSKLVEGLRKGILDKGDLILVGNTPLVDVLRDKVLESFGV